MRERERERERLRESGGAGGERGIYACIAPSIVSLNMKNPSYSFIFNPPPPPPLLLLLHASICFVPATALGAAHISPPHAAPLCLSVVVDGGKDVGHEPEE
jgi:hypothetical protein